MEWNITKVEDPQNNITMLLPLGFKIQWTFQTPKKKNLTANPNL